MSGCALPASLYLRRPRTAPISCQAQTSRADPNPVPNLGPTHRPNDGIYPIYPDPYTDLKPDTGFDPNPEP